jgi:Na+-driven multidrug efflux pump
MVIWPTAFLFAYYFRAIGKAAFTMWVAIAAMWIFRIGLAYLFVKVLGMSVLGVWYAMFVDWVFRTIVYLTRFPKSLPDKAE